MNRSQNETIRELINDMERLSASIRPALAWLEENGGFALELCAVKAMTLETRIRHIERACRRGDAAALALVLLEMRIHETTYSRNMRLPDPKIK